MATVNEKMTALANAIREKTSGTDALTLDEMTMAVQSIEAGTDTSDATATANDILSSKTAYVDGEKITGTIATKTSSDLTVNKDTITVPAGYYATQTTKTVASGSVELYDPGVKVTPSISVSSDGLVTAEVGIVKYIQFKVTDGYIDSAEPDQMTISGHTSQQLTTKEATTYTPTTSDQTISGGTYLTGTQTIKGDANLVAENIKSGISIFGVEGNYNSGDASEIDIFPLQTVSEFTEDTNDLPGTYYKYVSPFEIKEGETYYVEWDGTTYTCEGIAVSFNGINAVYLGNGSMLGFPHNNEPFTAVYFVDFGRTEFVTLADGSYNIRVYQKVSNGDIIENVPIDLDFTEGDQTINAPEGYLVKSAIIRKPENLKPENIVKDVEIAGIVGTNEGGGGGGSSSAPRVEYTYNNNGEIITAKGIGLTTIPDHFFYQNKTLEILDLSECPNLTTTGSHCCYQCTNLKEVIWPASLTSIGTSSFSGCSQVTKVNYLGTLSNWISMNRYDAFGTQNNPPTLYIGGVEMDWSTFEMPSDVSQIGGYAFTYAPITSVTIPEGVTSIGNGAFEYCRMLAGDITIPDSVTKIGSDAFSSCSSLTSITFGSGINTMGSGVLNYCNALTSITFKEGMTCIGNNMCFSGAHIFTSIVIPASIQKIGINAFTKASKLTSATFVDPNGWYVSTSSSATSGTNLTLTNPTTAATYLRSTHKTKYWFNT